MIKQAIFRRTTVRRAREIAVFGGVAGLISSRTEYLTKKFLKNFRMNEGSEIEMAKLAAMQRGQEGASQDGGTEGEWAKVVHLEALREGAGRAMGGVA